MRFIKKLQQIIQLKVFIVACILIIIADLLWFYAEFSIINKKRCFCVSTLPAINCPILILGAGVLPNKKPSQLLQARLEAGLAVFKAGKGSWFLVSGDSRSPHYNEPKAMKKWLLSHGVPKEYIISDFYGQRTYDSIKRAKAVFGIQKIIIVTSDFHISRALFLARSMDIDAYGIIASTKVAPLKKSLRYLIREYMACHLALWNIWFPPEIKMESIDLANLAQFYGNIKNL